MSKERSNTDKFVDAQIASGLVLGTLGYGVSVATGLIGETLPKVTITKAGEHFLYHIDTDYNHTSLSLAVDLRDFGVIGEEQLAPCAAALTYYQNSPTEALPSQCAPSDGRNHTISQGGDYLMEASLSSGILMAVSAINFIWGLKRKLYPKNKNVHFGSAIGLTTETVQDSRGDEEVPDIMLDYEYPVEHRPEQGNLKTKNGYLARGEEGLEMMLQNPPEVIIYHN